MKNKKEWDVLILSGEVNDIEIAASYIYHKSLGCYCIDDKHLYYFNRKEKIEIQNILEKHIMKHNISFDWTIQEYEDWHLNWKNNFTPIEVNNELIIIPNWDKNHYKYNKVIKIKPGMAFGTGHHETTFLMLKYLIKNIKKDNSVLDLGSGSGILSITSKIYGAKKITALEIDSICRDNFFDNLKLNNIKKDEIELLIEDVLCFSNFNYDLILANINKNIIKELIPKIGNTDARIILSGILKEDKLEINSLCKLYNMNIISENTYNDWLLMEIEND